MFWSEFRARLAARASPFCTKVATPSINVYPSFDAGQKKARSNLKPNQPHEYLSPFMATGAGLPISLRQRETSELSQESLPIDDGLGAEFDIMSALLVRDLVLIKVKETLTREQANTAEHDNVPKSSIGQSDASIIADMPLYHNSQFLENQSSLPQDSLYSNGCAEYSKYFHTPQDIEISRDTSPVMWEARFVRYIKSPEKLSAKDKHLSSNESLDMPNLHSNFQRVLNRRLFAQSSDCPKSSERVPALSRNAINRSKQSETISNESIYISDDGEREGTPTRKAAGTRPRVSMPPAKRSVEVSAPIKDRFAVVDIEQDVKRQRKRSRACVIDITSDSEYDGHRIKRRQIHSNSDEDEFGAKRSRIRDTLKAVRPFFVRGIRGRIWHF